MTDFGGPYFKLPRSAIDTVQSGTLPYDILHMIIGRGTNDTVSSANVVHSFCVWFTPTFVVLAVLVLMTVVIPLSGCVFLCLWKWGHCFAKKHENLLPHHGYKCLFSLLIFTISIVSLMAGIFFGLISNIHLSASLNNLTTSANATFVDGFEYAQNTVNEIDASLIDQYHLALSSATIELANASELLVMPVLDTIEPTFSSLLSNGTQLLDHLDLVHADVLVINQSITTLRDLALQINSTLLSLIEASDNFTAACNGDIVCEETVPAVPFFCGLNEVENPVEFSSAFNDVDLNETRSQLSNQYELLANITRIASDLFNMSEFPYKSDSLSPISSTLDSIREYIDQVQAVDDDMSLHSYLRLVDSYIKRFDFYRNLGGYILFSFFGALLAPFLCGLVVGVLGYRGRTAPSHRNIASHSGALIIMIGVGASFSFSGFLLIVSSVLYTLSTLFQKVCNDLAPPDYVLFTNIVDNRTLWGGSTLLGSVFSDGKHNPVDLRLRQILTDCSNNVPIYQVIQGSMLFNLSELTSAFSSPEIPAYNFAPLANEAINEVLPNATRMNIQFLPNTIGNATHLPTFRSALSEPVLSLSLDNYTSSLNDLILIYRFMNMTEEAAYVEKIQNTLVDELNTFIRIFAAERDDLWIQLTNLEITLLTTEEEAENFIMSFDTFHNQTASTLSESFVPYVDSLFSHFANYGEQVSKAVRDDIGRCQPVADVYRNLHTAVCKDFLDGINGFWCSVLWCVCACLSLIVTGTIATIFLRRANYPFQPQGSKYDSLTGEPRNPSQHEKPESIDIITSSKSIDYAYSYQQDIYNQEPHVHHQDSHHQDPHQDAYHQDLYHQDPMQDSHQSLYRQEGPHYQDPYTYHLGLHQQNPYNQDAHHQGLHQQNPYNQDAHHQDLYQEGSYYQDYHQDPYHQDSHHQYSYSTYSYEDYSQSDSNQSSLHSRPIQVESYLHNKEYPQGHSFHLQEHLLLPGVGIDPRAHWISQHQDIQAFIPGAVMPNTSMKFLDSSNSSLEAPPQYAEHSTDHHPPAIGATTPFTNLSGVVPRPS